MNLLLLYFFPQGRSILQRCQCSENTKIIQRMRGESSPSVAMPMLIPEQPCLVLTGHVCAAERTGGQGCVLAWATHTNPRVSPSHIRAGDCPMWRGNHFVFSRCPDSSQASPYRSIPVSQFLHQGLRFPGHHEPVSMHAKCTGLTWPRFGMRDCGGAVMEFSCPSV